MNQLYILIFLNEFVRCLELPGGRAAANREGLE